VADAVLALDVGEARIGLARGELGSTFAFGRGYLERAGTQGDVESIVELARREGAARVVVGLPRRTDGSDSPQTVRAREFAAKLAAAGLIVDLEDERFTTRLATSQVRGSGLGRKGRREKGRVDEASAVLILETYLRRTQGPAGADGTDERTDE
jgi:putative Holliday junction resolvase